MDKHYPVISGRAETTDIKSFERVNGNTIIYCMPWFLTFSTDCEVSWWIPTPSNIDEIRKTTMLEF